MILSLGSEDFPLCNFLCRSGEWQTVGASSQIDVLG